MHSYRLPLIHYFGLLMMVVALAGTQQLFAQSEPPCAGVSPTAFVNWPQFQSDPCHTGFNSNEAILSPATVGNMVLHWSRDVGRFSLPVVASGVVYAGEFALKARNGARLWTLAASGSSAVANGILYVNSTYMYALDANTGALRWKSAVRVAYNSSPTVANGVVYVGGEGSDFDALDANTGALLWKYKVQGGIRSSPAVANGIVYVGDCTVAFDPYAHLYALDASTGALLWKFDLGSWENFSSPAVVNGVVYAGYEEALYALNATTGALLWYYDTERRENSSPAVASGVVYVSLNDDGKHEYKMDAIDAGTGVLLWSYATGYWLGTPAVANGVVYVGSRDKYLYVLDATTGALIAKYPTQGFPYGPAVANGMLYVISGVDSKDYLYAFGLPK